MPLPNARIARRRNQKDAKHATEVLYKTSKTAVSILALVSMTPVAQENRSIKAAIDEAVLTPVLTASLYERFNSRREGDYANKLLSAMRFEFGGHSEKPKSEAA